MPELNGIKYPDTPADMEKFKDKSITSQFAAFWPTQKTGQDNVFLKLAGSASGEKAYGAFEKTGLPGKCLVTLSKTDQNKLTGMLSRGDVYATKVSNMVRIVKLAESLVIENIKAVALGKFYASPAFKKAHRKAVYDRIKVNKKLAEKMHLSVADMKNFHFHMKMGETQAAAKLFETASKAADLKAKAPQIVKKLMKQNNM